jgi:single-stranded-DNA-specific exonuclease
MNWITLESDATAVEHLADTLSLSKVIATLLVQRGIEETDEARSFLRPDLAALDNPFALTNLEAAVIRIEKALAGGESIVVFGDYDVDGVTSTVQLVRLLRILGVEPRYSVPRRMEEGYGISHEAIERIFAGNPPDLFIALDCGTNAHEPLAYLREMGVDIIVIDHHQAKEGVPEDCILVNPHVHDAANAPWRQLCTAGLVFKLLHGILKRRREAEDPRVEGVQLKDFLDLVAMGTVADLVPLQAENRILAWYGLHHLRANERPGVRALCQVSGIALGQALESADISFKLAPRINASGRLADASQPIELLLNEDSATCLEIAQGLDAMNRERQGIERGIALEAETRAKELYEGAPGFVLHDAGWHPGVVGIVASRVSRHFHKPCVVLGSEGTTAKGSGRSVSGVDLVQVFQRCSDLLEHWGGHPMAAGVSIPVDAVPEFRERFLEALQELYPEGLPDPTLELSAWLELSDFNTKFLEELDRLQPFGQGNPQPIFGLRHVKFVEAPQPFAKGGGNYRMRLPAPAGEGRGINGVAWQMESMPEVGEPVDLALRISWNYLRQSKNPQVTLIDWKPSA